MLINLSQLKMFGRDGNRLYFPELLGAVDCVTGSLGGQVILLHMLLLEKMPRCSH